jgi:predicted transcriptional regulator
LSYTHIMATITFRTDPESERALNELAKGQSRTAVIKAALLLAAQIQRRAQVRAEATALAADPEDVAEIRAVREEMDALRAW